jgi:hypothetical protein
MPADRGANVISEHVARLPRPGYDHSWFEWRPLPARPPIVWPGGCRTAVSVVIDLTAVEWEDDGVPEPRPLGGRGVLGPPDVPRMSHREFGHRVGIFRLLEVLAACGIRPAVVVDVLTVRAYPGLLTHVTPVAAEILCGGLSASRPLTAAMSRDEEAHYIRSALDGLAEGLGSTPVGWLSPNRSESQRTPQLLAEAGVGYVAEWANDDAPYAFAAAADGLWSYPLSWELSDEATAYLRMVDPDVWARSAIAGFDAIHAEGGRVFNLHLAPWLSGQAFRAAALGRVLNHLVAAADVYLAPPVDVVAHCRAMEGS